MVAPLTRSDYRALSRECFSRVFVALFWWFYLCLRTWQLTLTATAQYTGTHSELLS